MREVNADVNTLKRLRLAAIVLFALGAIVALRLFQFQILQHDELFARSEQQYLRELQLEPQRGTIYDRNMTELAVSVPVSSLYANSAEIANPQATATALSFILETSADELSARLNSSRHFVWVQRKMAPWQAERIASLGIKGASFVKENKRYYPKRTLAAQVLGFVGTDNEGLAGLELKFDKYIGGEPSRVLVEKDARGRSIYASRRVLKQGTEGLDILVNLDETIQYIAEKELAFQVAESRARGGAAIVMDPHSGEVLALAHQPSFNPNSFLDYAPTRWKGSAVANLYEPGSTFKVVTLAAALEEGVAQPDDMIYAENGALVVAGKAYRDVHKYGWLAVREVISKSSNVGTIKLGQRLEPQALLRYVRGFGFGEKTGIELPGEASGEVRDVAEWSKVSQSSLSIGYEVSVTPIQLITAYAAVANGGTMVQPRLMRGIMKDGRIIKEFAGQSTRRVISAKTAAVITSILQDTVISGTGQAAAVKGFTVAGKTGTAMKFDPESGVYTPNKYIASFVGYLPADDPRVVILVAIDEPKGAYYGGSVAAPAFSRIASQVVRYLRMPHQSNILKVAALYNAEEEKASQEKRGPFKGVLSRVSKGFQEIVDRTKTSLSFAEGKAAGYNTKERHPQ